MKRFLSVFALLALTMVLAGCDDKPKTGAVPPPHPLTADAIGSFCNMNVLEHPGPKGQILLSGWPEPVWFSSARDTFAYTMLPEAAKNVAAIYVSDMAKAETWENPGVENWIEARKAVFVIGSELRSGMGAEEAVPFGDRAAAEGFVAEHGGHIVGFAEVPRDYILGSGQDGSGADEPVPPRFAEKGTSHAH
jgi:copper chaperone NosL